MVPNSERKSNRERNLNYEPRFLQRIGNTIQVQQASHNVKDVMSNFKDNLLRKITEAFEFADF